MDGHVQAPVDLRMTDRRSRRSGLGLTIRLLDSAPAGCAVRPAAYIISVEFPPLGD